eukprot:3577293-Prymnesium_polylepis.1
MGTNAKAILFPDAAHAAHAALVVSPAATPPRDGAKTARRMSGEALGWLHTHGWHGWRAEPAEPS